MAVIKRQKLRSSFVYFQTRCARVGQIAQLFRVKARTVRNAARRYEETGGNKNRIGQGRNKTARDEAHQVQAADLIAESPSSKINYIHELARKLGILKTSTHDLLKEDLNLFLYKLKSHQELGRSHIEKRLIRCTAMKQRFP
uniref:Transposase n=1 Tax=Ditylenchus dipsaci TaxID=166011 RepID=A0A915CSP2_9BILA